jgi:glycine betaine/proline transport system substrate-binding protein
MEDKLMGSILFEGQDPSDAAEAWLKTNADTWTPWLNGVTTFDGQPAAASLKASLGS